MRKTLLAATVAVVIAVLGGIALAGDTNTLTVNATLAGACNFITPKTATLSFTLDATSTSSATATVSPTFWCTKGTTVGTPSTDNGLNPSGGSKQMKSASNPTEFIPYSLVLTPSATTGSGKSTPINLKIDGTVLNAAYIDKTAANDYSDTVVVTIAP